MDCCCVLIRVTAEPEIPTAENVQRSSQVTYWGLILALSSLFLGGKANNLIPHLTQCVCVSH